MNTDANRMLRAYYDQVARTDEQLLESNKDKAERFVNGFVQYVRSSHFGLAITPISQGSSFEGLKVGKPDEFDFLVVFLDKRSPNGFLQDYPHDLAKAMENYKTMTGKLHCYRPITLPQEDMQQSDLLRLMQGTWYGTASNKSSTCLSARKAIEEFKKLMRNYKSAIENGQAQRIRGIADFTVAKSGYPNVKVELELDDYQGTKINIDVSPAVRFNVGGRHQYYIAKKHPQIRNVDAGHLELMWLDCFSPEEQQLIHNKKAEYEKRNYKIVKSLLGSYLPNAYIWKTLFMLEDTRMPEPPLAFLYQMVAKFQGALYAELKQRGHEVPSTIQDTYNRLLYSKFNRCENVLARFKDSYIWRWFDQFSDFRNLLEAQKHVQMFRKVIGKTETDELQALAPRY